MSYYRTHFPNASVLPKMHILEHHVADWLEQWRVGLGEQGIHTSFNSIERSYMNMPNRADRLFQIVQGHHLRTPLSGTPRSLRQKNNSSFLYYIFYHHSYIIIHVYEAQHSPTNGSFIIVDVYTSLTQDREAHTGKRTHTHTHAHTHTHTHTHKGSSSAFL